MRTEEELTAAFQAGELSEEERDRFLSGDDFSDTVKTEEVEPDEASQAQVKTEEAGKDPEQKDPVVLARDGVHTIPFSEVEKLRENLQTTKGEADQLRQELLQQKDLLDKLTAAQKQDDQTGTTEKVDELVGELADEFPNAAKLITSMQKQLAEIADEKTQTRELQKAQTEAGKAAEAYADEISKFEPTYREVTAKPEFWEWFDKQSPLVRSVQNAGDAEAVAEVVKLYNAQQAPASDKAKDVVDKAKEAVKAAMEKASAKPTVQTLSDIPGGTNPASDEIEAFSRMPREAQTAHMLKLSQEERNKLLDKLV